MLVCEADGLLPTVRDGLCSGPVGKGAAATHLTGYKGPVGALCPYLGTAHVD